MELGIGMFGDLRFDKTTRQFQSAGQRLQEIIEEVKLADQLEIDLFAMGEHHRPDYAVSAPEIMLSALSTTTQHIKLVSGVSVISSSDPVKLYQDFSMLDLISNQRAEILAGRGSFIESFPLFGYDLNNYVELFEEKLDLLHQLNENETLTWEGKHRAALKNQTIYPRPERKIPIWIAVGGTPSSVERAAKYGFPIIFAIIGGTPDQFLPLINYYKEQYIASGHDPAQIRIGVHSHAYIGNSDEEVVKKYFSNYAEQMNRIGKDRGWGPYTLQQFRGGMSPQGSLFMGNWEAVAEKIIRTIELFGLTRFIAHIDNGAPHHKEIMKTIELYGEKVIPIVRKHFKK